MRQHDILRMRHAQFVEAVTLGKIRHEIDLLGARIAGNAADRLQADIDDRIARLLVGLDVLVEPGGEIRIRAVHIVGKPGLERRRNERSEEHTSELQSLMRISYAVFCLKKKTIII